MNLRMALTLAVLGNSLVLADNAPAQKKTQLRFDPNENCAAATDAHSGTLTTGGDVSAVSSVTYGSNQCKGRFIVEARWDAALPSPPSYVAHAEATWAGTPLSKQTCTSGRVSASFYGFEPPRGQNPGRWVALGTKNAVGQWTGFGTGWCSVGVGINFDSAQYTKLRVAARASTEGGGMKKVRASVSHVLQPK